MVDIIITAYNGHQFIRKGLNSLLKQTALDKILVTIVDNGSKDNYHDIINEYSDKMNIQELTIKKNQGPAGGRQYGINHTSNKYIMFLDCDDEFGDAKAIEKMLNILEENANINRISGKVKGFNTIFHTHLMQHGNIYRRSFLQKYHIGFKKSFNLEDLRFGYIVEFMLNDEETMLIDNITYIYNYERNEKSYTAVQRDFVRYIECVNNGFDDAIKFAKKYHKEKRAYPYSLECFSLLADTYFKAKERHAFANEYVYTMTLKKIYKFYQKYQSHILSAIKNNDDYIWVNNFVRFLENNCA